MLFAENTGVVIQSYDDTIEKVFTDEGIHAVKIGIVTNSDQLNIQNHSTNYSLSVSKYRDIWYRTSFLLDQQQTAGNLSLERYQNYKNQPLQFKFPNHFTGKLPEVHHLKYRPKAAIIREKGSNSEREMANAMFLAGFDVKDVHMTDLITGRETLEDIQFIGCLLYTSPSPRDVEESRMPSSA